MNAPAHHQVVVASYNVHRCIGSDGHRDPARIGDVIRALDADVIALQEVDFRPPHLPETAQMDLLAHMAGLQAVPGPTLERQGGLHYGNVLLTKLPVLNVRKLNLTVYRREPRGALDVDLDARGQKLRVIATHLGLLPSERRRQVKQILETIKGDDAFTVLLGDINEWFILGRPLRWLHARFGHGSGGRSWPSHWPIFKLDRIWVRPKERLKSFRVHATPATRVASDHLPVIAELWLRRAASTSP